MTVMPRLVGSPDESPSAQSTVDIQVPSAAGHPVSRIWREFSELTGLPFAVADLATGTLHYSPIAELLPELPRDVLTRFGTGPGPHVVACDSLGLNFYGIELPGPAVAGQMAVGFVLQDPSQPSDAIRAAAEAAAWSAAEWSQWLKQQQPVSSPLVQRLLKLAASQIVSAVGNDHADFELESLAEELDAVYEELSLLHDVARQLRISLDPIELAQLCLNRLHRSLGAEGCAVLLYDRDREVRFSVSGSLPLDSQTLPELLAQYPDHDWSRPLVRNHFQETASSHLFPDLKNFVVATVLDGPEPLGWIVAANSLDQPEFGSVEASLLSSIALILGTHVRNTLLFLEQEELLVSFVSSLVSSLDAKDSYTRGHSERVALIARRLSREVGLSVREQESIHLTSLLHDIGKIGVSDAVLQKAGDLSRRESEELQRHPAIGAEILSGLKNLQHIIPGVRHHHESFDGLGYPDGLAGEGIPLSARIVAVADAYDAMRSDRPYRGGLPLDQVENILADGSDRQWDPELVRAYFSARDDIARIWTEAGSNGTCRPAG
jgi:HD-GYP domain-containing protein (c-di-GMP phosphodiesterase class II)